MARSAKIIRSIWALCLIIAGLNHARILLQHGLFWDYQGVGLASSIYWSSLTAIDPLVATLLFIRPRIGVPATALVIATNVAHNLTLTAVYLQGESLLEAVLAGPQLISQIAFLIFVLVTWPMAMRDLAHSASSPQDQEK